MSLAAMVVYALLAWGHAHGQVSVIDEGMYLFKGYLFATGEYFPFQDYGPLTNHMPLSFLIPGLVQRISEPGIWAGRLMAIGLALLMLAGLWLASRRLVGPWWAAAAVWSITLNSMLVKVYSQAISQVLVACLLIWVVVLITGSSRKQWQILSGVFIAGMLFFTRINLAPVLVIVISYVFFQYGKQVGLKALALGIAMVVAGQLIFWPEILKLWAKWIPASLSPFLDAFRLPASTDLFWDPEIQDTNRVSSLILTLRLHYLPILGFLSMGTLLVLRLPRRRSLKENSVAWFLVSLFGVLFVAHAIASLGLNYCVYCLRNYAAFFSPVGLILSGIFAQELGDIQPAAKTIPILFLLLIIPILMGLTLDQALIESVLSTDVPKISAMIVQPGTTQMGLLLANKFQVRNDELVQIGRLVAPALIVLVLLATSLVYFRNTKLTSDKKASLLTASSFGLAAMLGLEMIVTTVAFSSSYDDYDCGEDVIAANESAGMYLSEKIPEGSSIYWGVGRSPVPLLYLPERVIFPAQLNGDYTFVRNGEPETIHRLSYWNEQLARDWLEEADYVLFEERVYSQASDFGFNEQAFDEITKTVPTDPCRADSSILIFHRAIE
jgi:hypothetical protein